MHTNWSFTIKNINMEDKETLLASDHRAESHLKFQFLPINLRKPINILITKTKKPGKVYFFEYQFKIIITIRDIALK